MGPPCCLHPVQSMVCIVVREISEIDRMPGLPAASCKGTEITPLPVAGRTRAPGGAICCCRLVGTCPAVPCKRHLRHAFMVHLRAQTQGSRCDSPKELCGHNAIDVYNQLVSLPPKFYVGFNATTDADYDVFGDYAPPTPPPQASPSPITKPPPPVGTSMAGRKLMSEVGPFCSYAWSLAGGSCCVFDTYY